MSVIPMLLAMNAATADVFTTATNWPPSLNDAPILAFLVTAGFWVVLLLAAQWGYAIIDEAQDIRVTWRHPLTSLRLVKLLLLLILLVLTSPRVALLTVWHYMTPEWREWCSTTGWTVYIVAAPLFAMAWYLDRRARPAEQHMLTRAKAPQVDLALGQAKKSDALKVLCVILVIAFATTFVRKAPVPYEPARAVNLN